MKNLKIIYYLLLMAVVISSCEKESIMLPENAELNIQPAEKENFNALAHIDMAAGELYALAPWDSSDNIALYDYNPTTDEIVLNSGFTGSTETENNYGFDFNYGDGLVYLLADGPSEGRYLYTYNKDTDATTLIGQIVSVGGNTLPQDVTFGNDNTLYFVFKNGEVNAYNIVSHSMSAFSTVLSGGAVGLTYDFDNNRLIYAVNSGPVQLYSVSIPSGAVTPLFTFYTPSEGGCTAQGIEFLGNNKLIATSTYGCDIIYTIDLATEETNLLLNPTGSYSSIKDLMFINNPDIDGDGCLNVNDAHPNSNLSETINIGGCYPVVNNVLVNCGTTMMDQIDDLVEEINLQYNGDNYVYLHKRFVTKMAQLTYSWRIAKLITATQRSKISTCASNANIPYTNWEY
ncbi:MAG: hypothetical protein Q7T92_11045 [Lutibacter sp.]|nr:hypothetical protein [Lutibacter sp.]